MFLEKSNKWDYKPIKDTKGIKNRIQGTGKISNNEEVGEPMLRMNNLTYKGEISLDDLKWVEFSEKEKNTFKLKNRNVLFNRTNSPELVGKIAVWDKSDGYTFAGYLVRLELNEEILNPYYLASFFNSDFGKKVLKSKARLSGNLANISGSTFLKQLILLPPIELQNDYEKIYLRVQKQKSICTQQVELLKQLFQAYLQNAFSEDSQIEEEDVFESLLQSLSHKDLKEGNRLNYLVNWLSEQKNRFSTFDNYDEAWNKLIPLLEEGSIEQFLYNNEIKLRVTK
ncbi:hypothetical protein [uncultured Microscilla sp.]|uniref:restriction endonuclease subunit S n=1 Tax=uncultured Microscilla sp. TaxID=432653 RepID=UPI00261D0BB6|nr:hypothetical protein [uncultured Microscilla sp.]